MSSRADMKRFNRSTICPNSPVNNHPLTSGCELRQTPRQKAGDYNQSPRLFSGNGTEILIRLSQLEREMEQERYDRVSQQEKMIHMIKEMECKHSSIIYDSEIRYFKSPPKPEIFFCHNQNNLRNSKVGSLKKVGSTQCFQKEVKQNISPKPTRNAQKVIVNDQNSKENPEKLIQYATFVDQVARTMQSRLEETINQKLTGAIVQLRGNFQRERDNLHQLMMRSENLQQNNFKNIYLMLQVQKPESPSINMDQLGECFRQLQQRTKNIVNSSVGALHQKIVHIDIALSQLCGPIQERLHQMCEMVYFQGEQVSKMQNMNQLNHSLYSNRLQEVQQFVGHQLDNLHRDRHKHQAESQNLVKQIEQQRAKQCSESEKEKSRHEMIVKIQQCLNGKAEALRVVLGKQIQHKHDSMEQSLVGVVEKHIGFVEEYIRKNIEKEEIIMSKYRSEPAVSQ